MVPYVNNEDVAKDKLDHAQKLEELGYILYCGYCKRPSSAKMVSKQTQTALGGAKNQRLREISVAKQAPKDMDPNKYAIKGTEDDPEILKNKYAEEPN